MDIDGNGIVKVPGVLNLNEEIRQELLKRIYWKDRVYTNFGGGDYVDYADPKTRYPEPPAGGLDILDYTHGDTKFASNIERVFMPKDVRYGKYVVPSRDDYKLKSWEGDYFEKFTKDNKLDEIGLIELQKGRAVNEFHRMDRRMETKYITPKLINFYGSSVGMIPLTNRFAVKNSTGRMSDIPEANVTFIHDFWDKAYTDEDFGQKKYLKALAGDAARVSNLASRVNHFLYEKGNYFSSYINFSQNNDGGRGVLSKQANHSSDGQEFTDKTGDFWVEKDRVKTDWSTRFYFDEGDVEHEGENERRLRGRETLKGEKNNLLHRTNKLFNEHKISTLVGRFHTSREISREASEFDSAKTPEYGNSHGRNLLKKDHRGKTTNEYSNPYCRVWTYHHQYDNNRKLIRPFRDENDAPLGVVDLQASVPYKNSDGGINGFELLAKRTVLNKNGYVNIAPSNHGADTKVNIRDCMFSIENLAWKDVAKRNENLTKEQIGPNGGRIMWFPPYDLDFQESINVDWNQSRFLGRGEGVYTYSNTERNGTLTFALFIDHPSVIDNIPKYNLKNSDGESGDMESDILRFFAGCQPLNIGDIEVEDEIEEEPPKDPKKDSVEVPPMEGHVIKFYVFYPNNYSGYYNGGNENIKEENPDPDWYTYLIAGRDIKTPDVDDVYNWHGYEIGPFGVTEDIEHTGYTKGIKIQCSTHPNIGYGYRVDADLRQFLVNKTNTGEVRGISNSNYNDLKSFGLNKKRYNDATHSFYEFYSALAKAFPEAVNSENYGDPNNAEITRLSNILKDAEFTKIIIKGSATIQDSPNTQKLARRRRLAISHLINRSGMKYTCSDKLNITDDEGKVVDWEGWDNGTNVTVTPMNDKSDINSLEAKERRFAVVELHYNAPKIENYKDHLKYEKMDSLGNIENPIRVNVRYEPKIKAVMENGRLILKDDGGLKEKVESYSAAETRKETQTVAKKTVSIQNAKALRYESESEYFHKLKDGDPLIYRALVDKFKYFDPAFHSISPEGFNARLTFLHQCTRQGHTIEAPSLSNYERTAGNLAFGRMPVCVLRIGDFINTKVIIRSISLSYGNGGPMQWDLNQEGIGVQPMYAKVSMQITILGGQSLEGPINRLQNAVSFNYYSNTQVYDNRSDVISERVDGNAKTDYRRIWIPEKEETVEKKAETDGTSVGSDRKSS